MNARDTAESKGRWGRGRLRLIVKVAALYALGLLCLLAIWKLPLSKPGGVGLWPAVAILILFGSALVFGLAGGVFLGRFLRSRLEGNPGGTVWLLSLVPVNLAVFALLGKPLPTEYHVTWLTVAISAVSLVSAAFLAAANAYVLGFIVFPARLRLSRRKSAVLLCLIYGSMLTGLLVGFRTDFWGRGFVPFPATGNRSTGQGKISWKEALDRLAKSFPPEIRSEEKDSSVSFRAPARKLPPHSIVGEVIEATGSVVMVGKRRVEFHGYAMIPQGATVEDTTAAATYWSPNGRPLDEFSGLCWPGFNYYRSYYWCVTWLSPPDDVPWAWWRFTRPHLIQLPWGFESQTPCLTAREGSFLLGQDVPCPVPGPAEFRFPAFIGDEQEYTIAAREGETLTLETNRILVAGIVPWPWSSRLRLPWGFRAAWEFKFRDWTDSIHILRASQEEIESDFDSKVYTTAVFYCDLAGMTPGLRIEAVTTAGELLEGECDQDGRWLVCRYPAEMEEIREFRIREIPEVVEIRFPVWKLQGLPPENENCSNRLDVRLPSLAFKDGNVKGAVDEFLGIILRPQHKNEGHRLAPGPGPDTPHIYEDVTVRDVLNRYYRGRWCVSDGYVIITRDRFGPIVWKVREAARETLGGRR